MRRGHFYKDSDILQQDCVHVLHGLSLLVCEGKLQYDIYIKVKYQNPILVTLAVVFNCLYITPLQHLCAKSKNPAMMSQVCPGEGGTADVYFQLKRFRDPMCLHKQYKSILLATRDSVWLLFKN